MSLSAVDASLRHRSKIDIVSMFCLSAFLRKQSFEAAILAGAKMSEMPHRRTNRSQAKAEQKHHSFAVRHE